MDFQVINVRGHYEVYYKGKFVCSGDTMHEAVREAEKCLMERR